MFLVFEPLFVICVVGKLYNDCVFCYLTNLLECHEHRADGLVRCFNNTTKRGLRKRVYKFKTTSESLALIHVSLPPSFWCALLYVLYF